MKRILLVIMLCWFSGKLLSQTNTIRVKAGEDMMDVLRKEIYIYPEFTDGLVQFRQGKLQRSRFNFNLLNGEMEFLSENKDTLSIAEANTIDYIVVKGDTFRYDRGYIRQLESNGSCKLGVRKRLKVMDTQKLGAYDQPSSSTAVASLDSYSTGLRSFKLNIRQDVVLAKQASFFFGDKFNHFQPATKKSLFDLFPQKAAVIENYLRENKVDYRNESDLRNLMKHLAEK